MRSNHSAAYLDRDRGICSTCDHLLTCRLHYEGEKAVFFCEEYACTPADSRQRKPEIYAVPRRYDSQCVVKKPESARPAYIGLCKICAKLAVCKLLKPGGGTWQCDSYEENAAE